MLKKNIAECATKTLNFAIFKFQNVVQQTIVQPKPMVPGVKFKMGENR